MKSLPFRQNWTATTTPAIGIHALVVAHGQAHATAGVLSAAEQAGLGGSELGIGEGSLVAEHAELSELIRYRLVTVLSLVG
jgi:hypothetical protein